MPPSHPVFRLWRVALFWLSLFSIIASGLAQDNPEPKPRPWESAIEAFEAEDKTNPPPQSAVLFVGSSSIRLWKLQESFPDLVAINRGFGGCEYSDVLYFADRVIVAYKPSTIVLYAGDNDIAKGKKPEEVFEDFRKLVEHIRSTLPESEVLVLSIKPSVARWKMYDEMKQTNALMEEYAKAQDGVRYVDAGTALLDENGMPRADLLLGDGLHLNAEGYRIWSKILAPLLKRSGEPKQ